MGETTLTTPRTPAHLFFFVFILATAGQQRSPAHPFSRKNIFHPISPNQKKKTETALRPCLNVDNI
jgi:hypothetical protein